MDKGIDENRDSLQKISTTIAEMSIDVKYLRAEIDDLKEDVKAMDSKIVSEERFNNLDNRVQTLEKNRNWIVTLVLTLVVTALIGLVIVPSAV